jgi:Ca-activated chloride channel family protein
MKHNSLIPRSLIFAFPLIAAMAAAQMIPDVQQEQKSDPFRISVQSQLVEVFLTVTKGNQWIPNLKVSEFRLSEDGTPVPILRLDNQDVPLQIVLLFDVSESIRDSLNTIQDAVAAFVESLNPEDRVTLVLFSSEIIAHPQTTDDREPILRAIRNARAGGVTRLNDAMLFGMNLLKDKSGRKAIVCFTDGQDTSGTTSRQEVRNAAAQFGLPIYTLGAGAGLELASLKMILRDFAEISGGKAFFIQNLRRLREVFLEVAAELRSAYVLHYYTQAAPDGRWHELRVETIDPKYSVHARKGFFAGDETK